MDYKIILTLNIKSSLNSIFFVLTNASLLLLASLTTFGYTLFDVGVDLNSAIKSIHSITITALPLYILVFSTHYFEGNKGKTVLMRHSVASRYKIIIIKFFEMGFYIFISLAAIQVTAWTVTLLCNTSLTSIFIHNNILFLATILFLQSIITCLPIASFGIFWASLLRSEMTALGASLGTYLILDLVKNYFEISKYFFSAYLDTPFQKAYDTLNGISGFNQTLDLYISSFIWTFFLLLAASLVSKTMDH